MTAGLPPPGGLIAAALRVLRRAGMDYDTARDTCSDIAAMLVRRLPGDGQMWAAQIEAQLMVRAARDHEQQMITLEDGDDTLPLQSPGRDRARRRAHRPRR